MGRLPIIHIPGKERILACPNEQLQAKKGSSRPDFSPSVLSWTEVRSLWTLLHPSCCASSISPGQRAPWVLTPLIWMCPVFLHCLCVELLETFWEAIVWSYFLYYVPLHTEPFLWGAQDHMPQLKDLIWSSIMPCWVSALWAELSRSRWWPDKEKANRGNWNQEEVKEM